MDHVTLILIGLIIKCEAGDERGNPHIIFSSLSSSKQQYAINYTVVANKPLYLHFQNMARGWCYNYYVHEGKLDKEEPPIIKKSTISYSIVTHSMSVLWKCRVFENKNSNYNKKLIKHFEEKYHIFLLNLHVKGAKSVIMTVNGKELTFGEADLSAPYDGHTMYFYEDGEHVKIDCKNPHSTGSVHLEYITKDGSNISDSATFSIQPRPRSNSSYIDCVYNSTEPADTYVYRVTFVIKKRVFYFNDSNIRSDMHISAKQDKGSKSSSTILGSSIGAVLIILGLSAVACWYVWRRKAKRTKTPYIDLSNHYNSQTPQTTNECENQYDECHYNENLSNRETYYAIPESVENMDSEDHYYTKVDYLKCKPKIGEIQTRDSKVYDEPYV